MRRILDRRREIRDVLVQAVGSVSDEGITGIVSVFSIGRAATWADRNSFSSCDPNVRNIDQAE
jgi:hypothetical protein